MTKEPIARCESCGAWTYLYALDKLMGHPHFCVNCKIKQKGKPIVTKSN
jgi:hypothetical protein